ncbi:hypothetical protein AN1V17_49640 [Vallitalea sediminicola]
MMNSYDDLTVMQKSKFDGLVDSHMQNDVVPDRVYGEDGIGIVSGEGTVRLTNSQIDNYLAKSLNNADSINLY